VKQKSPAFQLYPKDEIADARLDVMSDAEFRIWYLLRNRYWLLGDLPDDLPYLAGLIHRPLRQLEAAWPKVRVMFRKSKRGKLMIPELKAQEVAHSNLRKTRAKSAKMGAEKRWNKNKLDSNGIDLCPVSYLQSPICNSSSLRSEEKKTPCSTPAASNGFGRFWSAYPKRKAKGRCLNWWKIHKPDETLLQTMLAAIEQQKQWPEWQRGYAPHPHTWLNGTCWLDEPAPQPQPNLPGTEPDFTPDPARQARLKQIEAEAIEKRKYRHVAP